MAAVANTTKLVVTTPRSSPVAATIDRRTRTGKALVAWRLGIAKRARYRSARGAPTSAPGRDDPSAFDAQIPIGPPYFSNSESGEKDQTGGVHIGELVTP